MENKHYVKLIIANTSKRLYVDLNGDYADITRIFVEDHSPWECVTTQEKYDLLDFVRDYNNSKLTKNGSFAFLICKEEQMSAQQAIEVIKQKREKRMAEEKEQERKYRAALEKAKKENAMKKLAKTKEQKRKLLAQLKEEFGEK